MREAQKINKIASRSHPSEVSSPKGHTLIVGAVNGWVRPCRGGVACAIVATVQRAGVDAPLGAICARVTFVAVASEYAVGIPLVVQEPIAVRQPRHGHALAVATTLVGAGHWRDKSGGHTVKPRDHALRRTSHHTRRAPSWQAAPINSGSQSHKPVAVSHLP